MSKPVKPIPEGYHSITPYLVIRNATQAIEFYKRAFGAKELLRIPAPGNTIGHAEIKIGNSPLMLADPCSSMESKSPEDLGGSPVSILLYVEDVDSVYQRAISAGAEQVKEVKDQFYGDRCGSLRDPFGHVWHIATHKEDVYAQEMQKRAKECFSTAAAH